MSKGGQDAERMRRARPRPFIIPSVGSGNKGEDDGLEMGAISGYFRKCMWCTEDVGFRRIPGVIQRGERVYTKVPVLFSHVPPASWTLQSILNRPNSSVGRVGGR